MRLSVALLLALAPQAFAQQATQPASIDPNAPLTLTQAMADPDWIGTPIEAAWWSWDGQRAYTQRKRTGATIRDTWVQPIAGGAGAALDGAALGDIDAADPVFDAQRTRMAFVRFVVVGARELLQRAAA